MFELLMSEVIIPALVGTVLVCGYLLPAGTALYWRRWFAALILLLVQVAGLIALPFAPLATAVVWLIALATAGLIARDGKRDRQHREMLAALTQAAEQKRAA